MKTVTLSNLNNTSAPTIELQVCETFVTRFKGLMLEKEIQPEKGLVFDEKRDSRLNTAIHMYFMRFPIAVFWINSEKMIVSKTLANPWHSFYAPEFPARYVVETHPSMLKYFQVGDKIIFNES